VLSEGGRSVHTSVTHKSKPYGYFGYYEHREPEEEEEQEVEGGLGGEKCLEARRGEGQHEVS
jgi:hypothetical protein